MPEKARSAGIEVSVAYSPVERLTLNAAYGYTNAKFIEFNNGKEDYSGRFVPYAPQNTIFAAANYLIPAQFGPLRYISTGLSTQGIGKIYWNEDNSTAQNLYFKLDASVKLICNKFSVDLWAKTSPPRSIPRSTSFPFSTSSCNEANPCSLELL